MGLFVMIFSYKKMEATQNKDKAILNAYMMGGATQVNRNNQNRSIESIAPKTGLPFYNNRIINKYKTADGKDMQGGYLWLFSNTR